MTVATESGIRALFPPTSIDEEIDLPLPRMTPAEIRAMVDASLDDEEIDLPLPRMTPAEIRAMVDASLDDEEIDLPLPRMTPAEIRAMVDASGRPTFVVLCSPLDDPSRFDGWRGGHADYLFADSLEGAMGLLACHRVDRVIVVEGAALEGALLRETLEQRVEPIRRTPVDFVVRAA